jgi:tetratricopeptide (TPR) repeat protein
MGRFSDSAAAFEKAVNLQVEDATLYADYADALAMSQDRRVDDKVLALVGRALKLDPDHPKALIIAGTAALQRKDYRARSAIWSAWSASLRRARNLPAWLPSACRRREPKPALKVTRRPPRRATQRVTRKPPRRLNPAPRPPLRPAAGQRPAKKAMEPQRPGRKRRSRAASC